MEAAGCGGGQKTASNGNEPCAFGFLLAAAERLAARKNLGLASDHAGLLCLDYKGK
jgi:hypothetical protein